MIRPFPACKKGRVKVVCSLFSLYIYAHTKKYINIAPSSSHQVCWGKYCDEHGEGKRDPARHDIAYIEKALNHCVVETGIDETQFDPAFYAKAQQAAQQGAPDQQQHQQQDLQAQQVQQQQQ